MYLTLVHHNLDGLSSVSNAWLVALNDDGAKKGIKRGCSFDCYKCTYEEDVGF